MNYSGRQWAAIFPGSIQEASLLWVSGSLDLVELEQRTRLMSSYVSEVKLKHECKPNFCALNVLTVLRFPFTSQMVYLGPHSLTMEPQYPEFSLGPAFLPGTSSSLFLVAPDSWMELWASPSSGRSSSWFSLWASQAPILLSSQRTASAGLICAYWRFESLEADHRHSPEEKMT